MVQEWPVPIPLQGQENEAFALQDHGKITGRNDSIVSMGKVTVIYV